MRRRWHPLWGLLLTLVVSLSGCTWLVRASVSTNGDEANGASLKAALDGDGRFLAFTSSASNLVPNDTNAAPDVFVRDNLNNTTERVSVTSSGAEANGGSEQPSISSDGRYIAFRSWATNLVADDTDAVPDVFVRDRQTGMTERITSAGGDQPRISGAGRYVVYVARNFSVKVYDREIGTTDTFAFSGAEASAPDISDDGHFVVFELSFVASQTTIAELVDRQANTSTQIPEPNTYGALPVLSGDGRVVVMETFEPLGNGNYAGRLVAEDLSTGHTQYVSVTSSGAPASGGGWYGIDVSGDGRFVAFTTNDALTPQDTNSGSDVYVRDLLSKKTFLAGKNMHGKAPGDVFFVALSGDGRYVAFMSGASDIVNNDNNNHADVFVRAFPEPNPTGVTPSTISRGTTTTVTITGSYFLPGATMTISGSGVQVVSATRVDENTMTADLQVADNAATGGRDIRITIPGTGPGTGANASGTCAGCVTIA